MRKRSIDLVLALVAAVVAVLLSWPYFRDYGYWAESPPIWIAYFAAGFVLAVYVFYVFLGALHTLFAHDALEHAEAARARAAGKGGRP